MDDHIPFVHNYCDRWCDRCTLASRCRVYEQDSRTTPEQQDISNQAFWEHIASNLTQAMEMLQEKAEEMGIDLTMSEEQEIQLQQDIEKVDEEVRQNRLSRLCKEYEKKVDAFMTSWPLEKIYAILNEQQLQIVTDCYEVIMWYDYFIEAKIHRALHGRLTDAMLEMDDLEFPKDSDGSAKIALIAIDRSIAAWMRVYELLRSAEDECLPPLIMLQQLKKLTEQEFPNAYNFIRPGFDEWES